MSELAVGTPASTKPARRIHLQRRSQDRLFALLGAAVLLLAWIASVTWFKVPAYILPSPLQVLNALWSGLDQPLTSRTGYYLPLASTLANAGQGFLLGALFGIVSGSLMAEFRPLEAIITPYVFALQSLPKVAIAPLVVIWFGFGDSSKIAMSAMLAFFPMMVNTLSGLRSTEPERLDLMRALSASRLETYRVVKLPSAATYIMAGLDMAVVYALLGDLIAEFLGAQQGIGVVIMQAQSVSDVPTVFAALILLGATGILLHLGVQRAEHRLIHWSSDKRR